MRAFSHGTPPSEQVNPRTPRDQFTMVPARRVTSHWYPTEHAATPAIHTSSAPAKNSTLTHAASETAAAYLSGGCSRRMAAAIESTYGAMNDAGDRGSRSAVVPPGAEERKG